MNVDEPRCNIYSLCVNDLSGRRIFQLTNCSNSTTTDATIGSINRVQRAISNQAVFDEDVVHFACLDHRKGGITPPRNVILAAVADTRIIKVDFAGGGPVLELEFNLADRTRDR